MQTKLLKGNNIELLKTLEDNSIDSIITDPPYGLAFMNKKWDYDVPSIELWKEVYRVLKPGGHILSFGGTRTYHRMVVNIEDAGFEIRDCIQWIYGSGFPKSLNIGKAMDKLEGNEREVIGETTKGLRKAGNGVYGVMPCMTDENYRIKLSKGNTQWEGWGTALKPANEPIVLARKPLDKKSIVENVKEWGTGGINIDGCRIGTDITKSVYGGFTNALMDGKDVNNRKEWIENTKKENGQFNTSINEGRFPSNVILDEEAAEIMDEQSGISKGKKSRIGIKGGKVVHNGGWKKDVEGYWPGDYGGGASRFFYVAKVSKKERNMGIDKNKHPTIKPINLLTYLIRLITPPNGVVLDMYMGSGSTGIAALLEGKQFIGMEMDEEYFNIAEARINNYEQYRQLIKK